jgi:two-component system, NarL family, sensor kinase
LDAEKRLGELILLKDIAELLNKGTDILTVLSEVLKKLLHVTGLHTGWIFLIDDSGTYELAAKENLPPALLERDCAPMCHGKCWCIGKYRDGRLDKATNIIECKRLEEAIEWQRGETYGLTHHATVPLKAGNEKFGLLNIGSPSKTHFDTDELALLESVALQIGTALKRLKLTLLEQETALVAERNRLARDLHDSVNQLLFSLNLTARGGKELTQEKEVVETFDYIQDLAQEALHEMRALIWQLRPRGLENGIVSALSSYGEMLGLTLDVKVKGVVHLPARVEEVIWRIGQESMANCKKHSGQSEMMLEMNVDKNQVIFLLEDQGCGFLYDDKKHIPSIGLRSMKERTEEINGQFLIESYPGKGTKLQVLIPF